MNNIMSTSFLIFFHKFFTKKISALRCAYKKLSKRTVPFDTLFEVVSYPGENFFVFADKAVYIVVDELDVSFLGGKFM